MSVLQDPRIENLLARLHGESAAQSAAMKTYFMEHIKENKQAPDPVDDPQVKQFLSDKLIALDRDKAEFCYQLCRALDARRVVEAGSSFGVSTLYLAAAVRDNSQRDSQKGIVIGTEYEPAKAAAARGNFAEAGLADFIELREGDLRQTLRDIPGPVDFMLVDTWIPLALPALELVHPHLRYGAIVVCDNTRQLSDHYTDYLAFVRDPANGFRTATLPFEGGLEVSVRCEP